MQHTSRIKYKFEFVNLISNRRVAEANRLSAGQRARLCAAWIDELLVRGVLL